MTDFVQWEGFQGRIWKEEVNTRDFIQKNYRPYSGDESFLAGPGFYGFIIGKTLLFCRLGTTRAAFFYPFVSAKNWLDKLCAGVIQ